VMMASNQAPIGNSPLRPLPDQSRTAPAEAAPQDLTHVTYRNGLLTIDAQNVTLADVLRMIAQKTGATIDVPVGAGTERIVEHAGPGTPNDVLAQLLNGSHLNFIIVNSVQNPENLAQVILSVQAADTAASPPVATAPEPTVAARSFLVKPPEAGAPPVPHQTITMPSEPMSREALGEFLEQKHRAIREAMQQSGGGSQPTTPPPPPPPADDQQQ
jgi:hypothetical protein